MTNAYFHKLTIERCQYNMAQLAAVIYTIPSLEEASTAGQTVQTLVEMLSRDLSILKGLVENIDDAGNNDRAANDL
jgi:hypothetical protein